MGLNFSTVTPNAKKSVSDGFKILRRNDPDFIPFKLPIKCDGRVKTFFDP